MAENIGVNIDNQKELDFIRSYYDQPHLLIGDLGSDIISLQKGSEGHYDERTSYNKIISFEEFLKLKNISIMKYKQGDILINANDTKIKILGICGEVYFRSEGNNFDKYQSGYTKRELDKAGFKLYEEPKVLELTLDEVAKKFNIPVDQLKIKK